MRRPGNWRRPRPARRDRRNHPGEQQLRGDIDRLRRGVRRGMERIGCAVLLVRLRRIMIVTQRQSSNVICVMQVRRGIVQRCQRHHSQQRQQHRQHRQALPRPRADVYGNTGSRG